MGLKGADSKGKDEYRMQNTEYRIQKKGEET